MEVVGGCRFFSVGGGRCGTQIVGGSRVVVGTKVVVVVVGRGDRTTECVYGTLVSCVVVG